MKKFVGGMSKDTGRVDQPEGTYRDALNINLNYVKGAVVNEEGTTATGNTPMHIIGAIPLTKDQVALLGHIQDPATEDYDLSAIVLLETSKGISQLLYVDRELNFVRTFPITGEYKIDPKGDTIIYFTDNYYLPDPLERTGFYETKADEFNPPRAFNITRQKDFIDNAGSVERLYTAQSNFSVEKLNLFPEVGRHSVIQRIDVNSGGKLQSGAYQLALCYSDENFLETDYFTVSNPVYIYPQSENALPADSHVGAPAGTLTTKSINALVKTFPSINYKFLQPTIIRTIDGSETAVKLERIPIPQNSVSTLAVNYSGFEDASAASVEDVIVDNVRYTTAKSLAQLDDRLYLANLRAPKDIGYQRYALEIDAEPVKLPFENFDVRIFDINSLNVGYAFMLQAYGKNLGQSFRQKEREVAITLDGNKERAKILYEAQIRKSYFEALRQLLEFGQNSSGDDQYAGGLGTWSKSKNISNLVAKGYKSVYFNHMLKGYRRGDVYAYYISFILKDGSESFAYHIPGRDYYCYDTANFRPNREKGSRAPDTSICDNDLLTDSTDRHQLALSSYGFMPEELSQAYGPTTRIYQVTDTTAGPGPSFGPNNQGSLPTDQGPTDNGQMDFWENQNELYPNTVDFKGASVGTSGGVIPGSQDLRGANVRHHKFPSNSNVNYGFIAPENTAEFNGADSHQDLIEDNITSLSVSNRIPFSSQYKNSILRDRAKARLLGVRFKNIRIPKHILSQVAGYKIYYAEKTNADRIVQGQSVAVPSHPRYASVPVQSRFLGRKGPYKKGFYLYGGLQHNDDNAMLLSSVNKGRIDALSGEPDNLRGQYVGHPVFTFHDFDMLRKKPTLDGITHATCQYALVFRSFQGGPGTSTQVKSVGDLFPDGFDQPGSHGANHRYTSFNSLDWVHPDLGNTQNFNQDGEIYDITDQFVDLTEDVANPYGYNTTDIPKRKRGKQKGKDETSTIGDIDTQKLSIGSWKGQVNIAASYLAPGKAMKHSGVIKGGQFYPNIPGANDQTPYNAASVSFFTDRHWATNKVYTQENNFWNFAVAPGSKKYIPGLKNVAIDEAAAFSGASILYNRGGESTIAIGLVSGLPHLRGLRPNRSAFNSYRSELGDYGGALSEHMLKWGDDSNWCFPDAPKFPATRIDRFHYLANAISNNDSSVWANYPDLTESIAKSARGLRMTLEGNDAFQGAPMAWLMNLNSIKTDVYNPFDKQKLVWTGLYEEIRNVDLETGISIHITEGGSYEYTSYYDGSAKTPFVYGGDTFITKHTFRTTSQSYGHIYFRGAIKLGDPGSNHSIDDNGGPGDTNNSHNRNNWYLNAQTKTRFQGDIPVRQGHRENLFNWGLTNDMSVWIGSDRGLFPGGDGSIVGRISSVDTNEERRNAINSVINNSNNWRQGTVDPVSTLFAFYCESDSNLGLRHSEDKEKGIETKLFDEHIAREVLFDTPLNDHTKSDNLLYNDDYSTLNKTRVARPYPKRSPGEENIFEFTNRVIRSKPSGLFISDKYRQFLANDFKDMPKDRGTIWTLFSQGGLMYIHTERSLYRTAGKEELQISAATAFVGSGNIFAQEPREIMDTDLGYGGTSSILGSASTPYGRFWISRRDRKMYQLGEGIQEVTSGMETWLRDNIPFQIEQFGIDADSLADGGSPFVYPVDATTSSASFGFTMGYDPKYKRVLITKKERIPTERFINQFNSGDIKLDIRGSNQVFQGVNSLNQPIDLSFSDPLYFSQGGWTLSYYPELNVWGSRHSYEPSMYVSTQSDMLSVNNFTLWRHDNTAQPGTFYGTRYNSEFEFIDNQSAGVSKVFTNVFYWADIVKKDDTHVTELEKRTYPGFDSYYVYNTTQVSAIRTNINYLNNARLVDKFWYLNQFRDLAKQDITTNEYINTGTANVIGGQTTSITAPIETEPMFTKEGVVNPDYIDSSKQWYNRKKLVDHFMGVRLINDNSSTNLVYLYAAGTKFRQSIR